MCWRPGRNTPRPESKSLQRKKMDSQKENAHLENEAHYLLGIPKNDGPENSDTKKPGRSFGARPQTPSLPSALYSRPAFLFWAVQLVSLISGCVFLLLPSAGRSISFAIFWVCVSNLGQWLQLKKSASFLGVHFISSNATVSKQGTLNSGCAF